MFKIRPYSDGTNPDAEPSLPPLAPNASVGKRWKFRRNLVIYVAQRSGLSRRLLADVFDLPRSRISEIVEQFREYDDRTKIERS